MVDKVRLTVRGNSDDNSLCDGVRIKSFALLKLLRNDIKKALMNEDCLFIIFLWI